MHDDVVLIIPVYNEDSIIKSVIDKAQLVFPNIVCVNDGSSDNTAQEISKTHATLVNHEINLGQGAAIQTGIEYALLDDSFKYFVTFDADGQHRTEDVAAMVKVMEENPDLDIVLGSRFLGKTENMSFSKKIILKAAIAFSNRTSKVKLTDTHNGLRVFNRKVAETINITMSDMAHASEIIHRIHEQKYKYIEVPVTIVYTDYSRSKGQSLINAVNIVFDLLFRRITK